MRERIRNNILALLVIALISGSIVAPLLGHPTMRVPSDPIDPMYNVWAVSVSLHQADQRPFSVSGLLDANAYYPAAHAAIYGDVFLGLLPFSIPVHWLVADPVALVNVLVALSFLLSGYGSFLVCMTLTGRFLPSLAGAAVFMEAPLRFDHAGHLSVQSTQWLVFGLWILLMAWKRDAKPPWPWLLAGALLGLAAITNLYIEGYLSIPAALALLFVRRGWTSARRRGVLIAIGSGLALQAPLALAYLGRHTQVDMVAYGSQASTDAASFWSVYPARFFDHLAFPTVAYVPFPVIEGLFPGALVIVLAVQGLVRRTTELDSRVPWGVFGLACAVEALGHHLVVYGGTRLPVLPWGLTTGVLPPLSWFRAPAQATVGLYLALGNLVALGAARLSWPRAALVALVLALAAELWQPLPTAAIAPRSPGDRWVAAHFPRQPALALPIGSNGPRVWEEQTKMLYDTIGAWIPLVNGQASVTPVGFAQRAEALSAFPSGKAYTILRNLNVHTIIVYRQWIDADHFRQIASVCPAVYSDADQWVCRI